MKLTPAFISGLFPGKDIREISRVELPNREISEIDDLTVCEKLARLNLSQNQLTEFEGIAGNRDISWLSLAKNQIYSMKAVAKLHKLWVLNLAYNNITRIEGTANLPLLKALILNNNKLINTEGIEKLTSLDTLVLSDNSIPVLDGLAKLSNLKKLSVAHNKLQVFPDLRNQYVLMELRLNNNRIMKLPELIVNANLKVIDLGSNLISRIEDLRPLQSLQRLKDLVLLGNPVAKLPDYRQQVEALLQQIFMLDRLPTAKNLKTQKKMKRNEKIKKHSKRLNDADAEESSSVALQADGEDNSNGEGEVKHDTASQGTKARGNRVPDRLLKKRRTAPDADGDVEKKKRVSIDRLPPKFKSFHLADASDTAALRRRPTPFPRSAVGTKQTSTMGSRKSSRPIAPSSDGPSSTSGASVQNEAEGPAAVNTRPLMKKSVARGDRVAFAPEKTEPGKPPRPPRRVSDDSAPALRRKPTPFPKPAARNSEAKSQRNVKSKVQHEEPKKEEEPKKRSPATRPAKTEKSEAQAEDKPKKTASSTPAVLSAPADAKQKRQQLQTGLVGVVDLHKKPKPIANPIALFTAAAPTEDVGSGRGSGWN